MVDYEYKYRKYKAKYNSLKNQIGGGGQQGNPRSLPSRLTIGTERRGTDKDIWQVILDKNGNREWTKPDKLIDTSLNPLEDDNVFVKSSRYLVIDDTHIINQNPKEYLGLTRRDPLANNDYKMITVLVNGKEYNIVHGFLNGQTLSEPVAVLYDGNREAAKININDSNNQYQIYPNYGGSAGPIKTFVNWYKRALYDDKVRDIFH
jgi:hypothetical protein